MFSFLPEILEGACVVVHGVEAQETCAWGGWAQPATRGAQPLPGTVGTASHRSALAAGAPGSGGPAQSHLHLTCSPPNSPGFYTDMPQWIASGKVQPQEYTLKGLSNGPQVSGRSRRAPNTANPVAHALDVQGVQECDVIIVWCTPAYYCPLAGWLAATSRPTLSSCHRALLPFCQPSLLPSAILRW